MNQNHWKERVKMKERRQKWVISGYPLYFSDILVTIKKLQVLYLQIAVRMALGEWPIAIEVFIYNEHKSNHNSWYS